MPLGSSKVHDLSSLEGSSPGEVALLAFPGDVTGAAGIADLVEYLINDKQVSAEQILILLRSDYRCTLEQRRMPYSDPDAVDRVLAEPTNRRMLATFRLIVNPLDSLAWASLLLRAALRLADPVCLVQNE